MPKVWEKFNRSSFDRYDDAAGKYVRTPSDMDALQPGDTVGILGDHNEIVTVVKISAKGHITTTSRQEVFNHKIGGRVVKERRYFTARGEEKGEGNYGSYRNPHLCGTLDVEAAKRASRYAKALHDFAEFAKRLESARGGNSGYSCDTPAEPITMDEYREIARLAKACLDDGWGDERPTPRCLECFKRRGEHTKDCSKRPPDPVPEVSAVEVVLDGRCPGCGMAGETYCTAECPTQSNPRPYDPAAEVGTE